MAQRSPAHDLMVAKQEVTKAKMEAAKANSKLMLCQTVCETLTRDWEAQRNTDCSVICDDGKILYLHKLIVCEQAAVLKKAFDGHFLEGRTCQYPIRKTSSSVIVRFFELLYGDIRGQPAATTEIFHETQQLSKVYILADEMGATGVLRYCSETLARDFRTYSNDPIFHDAVSLVLSHHHLAVETAQSFLDGIVEQMVSENGLEVDRQILGKTLDASASKSVGPHLAYKLLGHRKGPLKKLRLESAWSDFISTQGVWRELISFDWRLSTPTIGAIWDSAVIREAAKSSGFSHNMLDMLLKEVSTYNLPKGW